MVLHALGGQQPEGEVLGFGAGLLQVGDPASRHIVPFRQRGVFRKLLVPPVHLLLVQAAAEFATGAQQTLLIGKLVAQAVLFHGRRQVPVEARHRHGEEAVLLEPFEVVLRAAFGQRDRGRAADGIPHLLGFGRRGGVEAVVVAFTLER